MRKNLAISIFIILIFLALMQLKVFDFSKNKDGETDKSAAKILNIKVGYANNPGEPFDLGVHEWARLVEERSNGSMKLTVYPSSQLGSKNDLIDQMLMGDSVITLADGAFYSDRGVRDLGITFGPFLFETWDEVWNVTKGEWWADQMKQLEEKGLKVIGANWVYGERHILTTKPVRTLADLKGMKIRVPNNTIQVKGFEVLGAVPTPMALGEAYTSLQQGVIDGLENPLTVLYNGQFHEVAKYLTLSGHIKNFTTLVTGNIFFGTLTEEQQRILIDTCETAGVYNNRLQAEQTAQMTDKFKAEGVEIIEIDINEFKDKAMAFYDLPVFTSVWSKDLYKTVRKEATK